SRDLAAAQSQVAALNEEMRAKLQQAPPAAAAADQPGAVKGDKVNQQLTTALHQAEAQRATLAARLSKAEADLADQQARQNELLGQIDKLKAKVTDLEKQTALRRKMQAIAAAQPAPVAPTAAVPVPAAP